jgi:diphthine-ammonia ligase
MKVVALVSGGKDSCFAMMECVRYGHEIACLAHLRPPAELAPEAAEIDSFMYQSVGHNVVSLIAESMELPLVTGIITGTAVTTEIDYPETKDGDEVEDLFRLLQDVRARHPDIQGVCTGAIFSSYQRNRVESVYAMAHRR